MAVMGENFFSAIYSCFINTPHSGYNIREPKKCISFKSNTNGIQTEYFKLKVTVYTITLTGQITLVFLKHCKRFVNGICI